MSNVLVNVEIEVVKLILTKIWSTERYFKSETVDNVQVLPQSNLNLYINTRAAPYRSFWTSKQQSLKLKTRQFLLISIGKICSFFELSREAQPSEYNYSYKWKCFSFDYGRVYHNKELTIFQLLLIWSTTLIIFYLLCEIDRRMSFFARLDPLSIEIGSWQITSVIPDNNSVRV